MSCHRFEFNGGHGIVCLTDFYSYGGFTFEWNNYIGPVKVRKRDLEPAKRTGRRFYKMIDRWVKLSRKEMEKHRVA